MFDRLRTYLPFAAAPAAEPVRLEPKLEARSGSLPPQSTGTLADPWTAYLLGGYGPTTSGISVTAETAMRCTPVAGAVKVLAESVAQLPLHLYQRAADGSPEKADDHPVEKLLTNVVNPWTGATEFRLILQTHLSLFGNAYAYVNRVGDNIVELVQLDPRNVSVLVDPITMVPSYTYTVSGKYVRTYERSELLHIRSVGIDLYQGASPVDQAREAIGLALVMEQYAAGLFGRGARPSGVLQSDKRLSPDIASKLGDSFQQKLASAENAGKTLVLEDGMTFKQLQMSSVDTQFLELRKFAVMEIARVFRVPLHMLADLERVTFSNAEAMGQQFLSFTLLPILKLWNDALSLTLLTPDERAAGMYFDFIIDDIARADLANRYVAYSQAVNAGILNPNEIRAKENLPPYVGGEVFTRPVNVSPVDKLGQVALPIAEQPFATPNAGPVQPESNLVH